MLQPNPAGGTRPWIIDGTLIPVHDQSITAISKNYRRSMNTQIMICAHRRRVVAAGRCWPASRNDVIVARHTVAHLLDDYTVLGDGGYRGVARLKDWQILRQCHRRADAINHSLQIIAGLCNLKTHKQLRADS